MKKRLFKISILLIGLFYSISAHSVNMSIHLHNGTSCNVTITGLDAANNPITGLTNIALNANSDWVVTCGTGYSDYVASWEVVFGTCNNMVVDLTGANFLPFTPIAPPCFTCSATNMSAGISVFHSNIPGCPVAPAPATPGHQVSFNLQ